MIAANLKQLTKHSIIYGLGGLLTRLIGVLLLPIYTRLLTPGDYGDYSLLTITATIIITIAQVGVGSALFREIIYKETDENEAISTAFYFLLITSTLLFLLLNAFTPQLSQLIFQTAEYATLLSLTILTGLLSNIDMIALAKLRIHQKSKLFATITVVKFAIGIILNIYYIVILRMGVQGLVFAGLIQASISAFVALIIIAGNLRLKFAQDILARLLIFGLPLIPYGLSRLVLTYADRYFLQYYTSSAEVGIYSLGYRIGSLIYLIVSAIQLAWPANMYTIAKQPDPERSLAKILTYYVGVLGGIALALSVLAKEFLVILTTPAFYTAYKVVPFIVISYLLYGVVFMTNSGLETRNKISLMTPAILISAGINLGLNFLLIPNYGMLGAAWATLLSYTVLVVGILIVNLRIWYIPYEYTRLAKYALTWLGIYTVSTYIESPYLWLDISLKIALLLVFPLILWILRFFTPEEINAARSTILSKLNKSRKSDLPSG